MKSNDEELVRRTLSGEVESFGELISRYQGAVQGLAYHLAGSFEDAEDTLGSEKLPGDFTRRVLDEAVKRAREAQDLRMSSISHAYVIVTHFFCHGDITQLDDSTGQMTIQLILWVDVGYNPFQHCEVANDRKYVLRRE